MSKTLWHELVDAGLTETDKLPDDDQYDTIASPWYIRFLLGFSGWVASWFVLGFLALGLFWFVGSAASLGILGVLLSLPAFFVYKKASVSDFISQGVLVFSLAGQLCMAVALFEGFGYSNSQSLLFLSMYQCVLFVLVSDYLHRFLSAFFAMLALFMGLQSVAFLPMISVLLAWLFVMLWMRCAQWGHWRAFLAPFSAALSVALALVSVTQISGFQGGWLFDGVVGGAGFFKLTQVFSQLATAVLLLFLLAWVQRENKLQVSWLQLAVLLPLALVISYLVPGLAVSLVMIMVGVARQRIWLQIMGVLAGLGFVSWFYYDLSVNLLIKSVSLVVLGGMFLAAYFVFKPKGHLHDKIAASPMFISISRKVVLVTVMLSFVVVNYAVWQKEQLLKSGQVIYLPLAPVDPRSLMQGDYMTLRFALSGEIASLKSKEVHRTDLVVVRVTENNVAELVSLYRGQALQADEILLGFKRKGSEINIGSQAFFFQEGQRQKFEAAVYGEFVVASNGQVLLKTLRDGDLNLLGVNRLD